jgi:diketogulonate reductase-like aldo/keto reductase
MKAEAHQKEVLDEIGKAYDKSGAQVLLRYQIQRGVVVIPKSHNRENQEANLDLFDFELTAEDVEKIKNL